MKRPLSSQCILKTVGSRPKTAQGHSFKKMASILQKKYKIFQSRGTYTSSSKKIINDVEDKRKKYYVQNNMQKRSSQINNKQQNSDCSFIKIKTFQGLARSLGIGVTKQISFKNNNYQRRSKTTDFQQLNFIGCNTIQKRNSSNTPQIYQRSCELIDIFLNLKDVKNNSSINNLMKSVKKNQKDGKFIPYCSQTQQYKLLDYKLASKNSFFDKRNIQMISKVQKINQKTNNKRFFNQNYEKKLEKRSKVRNLTSKQIKQNINIINKEELNQEKRCKQFIIDEWQNSQQFQNSSQSFTSLFGGLIS